MISRPYPQPGQGQFPVALPHAKVTACGPTASAKESMITTTTTTTCLLLADNRLLNITYLLVLVISQMRLFSNDKERVTGCAKRNAKRNNIASNIANSNGELEGVVSEVLFQSMRV